MLIDPFTVIAQIVNFAVLAWALKRFLYDRIIDAMDTRESAIAERLEKASQTQDEADEAKRLYNERLQSVDDSAKLMLDQAREAARQQRELLVDRARTEVDEERRQWEHALQNDQRQVEQELRRRTTQEVLDLSAQVIADVANADLEVAAVESALARLAESPDARLEFLDDTKRAPVTVRTAFEMSKEQRDHVTEMIRTIGLPAQRPIRFERAPALLLGMEIQGDGTAFSWSSHDYLEQISTAFDPLHLDDDR